MKSMWSCLIYEMQRIGSTPLFPSSPPSFSFHAKMEPRTSGMPDKCLLVSYPLLTCSHLWLKVYLFMAIETQSRMLDCLVKALHPSLAPLDPCLGGNAVCAQSYDPRGRTLVSLFCPLRPLLALPPSWATFLEYIWYFSIRHAFPIPI